MKKTVLAIFTFMALINGAYAMDTAKVYEESCKACHGQDGMGAPVVGNKAAWANVTAKGMDTVYSHTINGFNAMPPKGGTTLSDAELKSVVDYMVNASK